MRRLSVLFGAAVSLVALSTFAHAQERVQIGVLECRGGASMGFIVGSVTNLSCLLRIEGQPPEYYVAQIRKVGIDLGITEQSGLGWAVLAPTRRIGPGELAGEYAGVQGSATVGVGVGANLLVGGSANTFALQPLSFQGQAGVAIAGGVEGLTLRPGR